MKNSVFTLMIGLFLAFGSTAQEIEIEKSFGGYTFFQDGEEQKIGQLVEIMETNQEAFDFMKKAQTNYTFSSILGFIGGGLIGWPLGTAIGGGDPEWFLAGIGAGVVAIAIPLEIGGNKNAEKAINMYNSSLGSTSFRFKPKFNIIGNTQGVGLSMKF